MSKNSYKSCPHNENNNCFVCTQLAQVDVPIDKNVCAHCSADPYRPQRLNIHTMNHLLKYNQTLSKDKLLQVISGEGDGFGKTLAITFSLSLLSKTPTCKCDGLEDILNVWSPTFIRNNLDSVITQLEVEARNRSLPFSRLLAKVLLLSLLSASSPPQE